MVKLCIVISDQKSKRSSSPCRACTWTMFSSSCKSEDLVWRLNQRN